MPERERRMRSRYRNPDGTMTVRQAMLLKHADELDFESDVDEDDADLRDEECETPQEQVYFGDEEVPND